MTSKLRVEAPLKVTQTEPKRPKATRDLLVLGEKFQKLIPLSSYEGYQIEIRPISEMKMIRAAEISGININELLGSGGIGELSQDQKDSLLRGEIPVGVNARLGMNSSTFIFLKEICKLGIVGLIDDSKLLRLSPEIASALPPNLLKDVDAALKVWNDNPQADNPNLRVSDLESLWFGALMEIGSAIMMLSMTNFKEIEDFFGAQKATKSS
jgi:hypothetical protein